MLKKSKLMYTIVVFLIVIMLIILFFQNVSEDKKPPVIEMNSKKITVSVKDGDDVLLKGVSAKDNRDGDLTSSIVVEGLSDFLSDGTRIVTYSVCDHSNNVAKAERTVVYSDYKSPEFNLSSDLTFYSSNTSMNLAERITASDVFDGDLTPFIKLTDDNIVIGQGGQYYAQVSVYNSAGDVSTLKLPVFVESFLPNPTAPQIELTKYLIYVNKDSAEPDWKGYIKNVRKHSNTVTNIPDEQYKKNLVIDSSNVSMTKKGSYYVTYEYVDENDMTAVTRLVVVVR